MAGLKFQCPKCDGQRTVNRRMAGRRIRCPECDQVIKIPDLPADVTPVVAVESLGEVMSDPSPSTSEHSRWRDSQSRSSATAIAVDNLADQKIAQVQPAAQLVEAVEQAASSEVDPMELEDEQVDLGPRPPDETEMDLTPMVDVTFLLLIFFVITASFASEKAIQQKTSPKDAAPSSVVEVVDLLTIRIDELNSYLIMLPDQSEREASNKQDLIIALDESRKEGVLDDVENVIIEAHEESIHSSVVAALDVCRSEGFANFQVKVVEEFD